MAKAQKRNQQRNRGEIEHLASGALRVKVYAGIDPVSGKRHYLRETVPPGPKAETEAQKVLVRLVNQVNEHRNPRTRATVGQLMERYLDNVDVDVTTRSSYDTVIRKHIVPLLGNLPLGKLNGEALDSFYKTLRTCRRHCGGRRFVVHRTEGEHECDDTCRPHRCEPLSAGTVRKVHTCLSGALKTAIRWQWITVNPLEQAHQPKRPTPDPKPPSPEEATAIVNEAFKDLSWGMLVWLAMTSGARRGELCALRWNWLDLDNATLRIHASIAQDGQQTWEKDTKTHQQRRITLDPETVGLLRAYRQHCETEARSIGITLAKNGRMFSPSVDHSAWIKPSTVTQRYRRMCRSLGLDMNLHQLRHYSATELIATGVDIRTVAGRLGHSGGGTTTLKVYSAWVAEADQKAASRLTGRMPPAPITIDEHDNLQSNVEREPTNPYQKIAADLRGAITAGILRAGDPLPAVADLARQYRVGLGTAHRAVAELKDVGLVTASRGKRAVVTHPKPSDAAADVIDINALGGSG